MYLCEYGKLFLKEFFFERGFIRRFLLVFMFVKFFLFVLYLGLLLYIRVVYGFLFKGGLILVDFLLIKFVE